MQAKLFKQVSDGFMNVFIGNEAAVKSASQGWWHGYTAYAVVGLQNDVEAISSIIGQLPVRRVLCIVFEMLCVFRRENCIPEMSGLETMLGIVVARIFTSLLA